MRMSRPVLSTCLALAAASAVGVVAAPTSEAASSGRGAVSLHVAASAVAGALAPGAGVTVVMSCPAGTDLVGRAFSHDVEDHDARLRLRSAEVWPAGAVFRYEVVRPVTAARPAAVVDGVACLTHLRRRATVVRGTASTDLRVWGPAPAHVVLDTATVVGVTDPARPGRDLATLVHAAGVGASHGSVRGAVAAAQAEFGDAHVRGVEAAGRTTRVVRRGRFASMLNRYTFRAAL